MERPADVVPARTPRKAREGYCIVRYDGDRPGVPAHLRARLVVQGVEFDTGKEIEVTAVGADCFRQAAFPGTATIVDGTPKPWSPVRPVHASGSRTRMDFSTPFTRPG